MKKIFSLFFLISCLCIVPFSAFAQEEAFDPAWQASQPIDNGADCFDYYQFQSVSVGVGPELQAYKNGDNVHFVGTITNDNNYPVVDGNIFVRIGKKNSNALTEGQNIVDEFIAVSGITIDANSKKPVDFMWQVPKQLGQGTYVADYFFSVGKKFNLGGLPFSNEIVAGTARFDVDTANVGSVSFDKSATTFNSDNYKHIGSWPKIDPNVSVAIADVLRNTSSQNQDVTIMQKLYRWDSLDENDLLDTKTSTFTIPAYGSQIISYDISQASESVYYLHTIAQYGDAKSIINERFSTSAMRPRLNFPAITKFPLRKGDALTLFTCFANTTNIDAVGTVHATITDQNGEKIDDVQYSGAIPSAMSAIKKDLIVKKDYDYITLKAEITDPQGGNIDQYTATYDCSQFSNCIANKEELISQDNGSDSWKKNGAYILFAIIVIIAVLVVVLIFKNKIWRKLSVFFFGALIMGGLFFGHGVYAVGDQSVSADESYNLHTNKTSHSWYDFSANGTVSVNHNMNITSGNTSTACGGSLTFGYDPTLTFNATGGDWDTPYGKFCSDYLSSSCFGGTIPNVQSLTPSGFLYFTGEPPTVNLSSSNAGIMTCSGMTCKAVAGKSGTVTVTATFPSPHVRVWAVARITKIARCPSSVTCSGSILGAPRCCNSSLFAINKAVCGNNDTFYWYSPTEDNFICNEKKVYSQAPNFTTLSLPQESLSWDVVVGSCGTDGTCGSANGGIYASAPGANLCSSGTASAVAGAGSQWTWACDGTGTGTTASCSATRTYSCIGGNPPFGASWCPGDSTGLTADVPWSQVSSCTAARKCEYIMPPSYSCLTPNPPFGANWCVGYDTGLASNLSWTNISSPTGCSSPNGSCQYYFTCAGSIPVGSMMCSGSDTGLRGPSTWSPTGGADASSCTAAKCQYYTPSVTYSCLAPLPPFGANWCSGYNTGLTADLPWTQTVAVSTCTTPVGSCQYYYSCAGSIPAGSTMCSGDATGLSGPGTWSSTGGTDTLSCTAAKCQYYTPSCFNNCSDENNHCIGTTFKGNCGPSCDGKKDCRDYNWQEVSPN